MLNSNVWIVLILIGSLIAIQIEANNENEDHEQHTRLLRCPKQFGRFGCRYDRRKYWLCINFVPFLLSCPESSYFDRDVRDCRAPGVVHLIPEHPKNHTN